MAVADVSVACWNCSITYALPSETLKLRKEQKKPVFCPGCGKEQHWPNYQTDLEKAQASAKYWEERATARYEMIEHKDRVIRSLRGTITRMKKGRR